MSVLPDLKNRGVTDTFFLVCDGLKGLPDVVGNVWPLTTVQTCIIHLIRTPRRYAPPAEAHCSGWRRRRTGTPSNVM